jgi:putative FmdB family regulatory protein
MATYDYRCPDCGSFEIRLAMGSATPELPCPVCGEQSVRIYTAPHLRQMDPALARARLAEEKSRDAPDVVTGPLPGRRRPTPRPHPALRHLPKP